ncbi:helix-turn-helix domain-containing protein [Phytohabitans rumicis]|uniref:XRE family transcriptional regulator n=1 Tax=Phytohabitans rumicis TaxID=1076125 RepID=A0A6V8LHD2_9ACTN|nr:XRE family transcriptional regulator [Phytohabitans rumicis]GFJ95050.1 XRE family transcriptional regulator [Phytohabitans rumicis]
MTEPAARIAANLRTLRENRGLSVVALAERSGVGRATLTNLEAGRGNPTIDTLYALADALGAALGDLIDERPRTPVEVIRAGHGTRVEGAVSARLLDRVRGHRLAELYEVDFATVARHADPHPPGVIESLLVTAGRLRTGPLSAPVELGPGDFIRFPGDVPHLYQAIGGPAHGVLVMSHP